MQEAAAPEMEEERYVEVASRFYLVKPAAGGGGGEVRRLHYLESCFLCKRSIAGDRDIFMYRGDAAFCSEDCRDEQMEMDDALKVVARRYHVLCKPSSSSSPVAAEAAAAAAAAMHRRPTIANLAARTRPVAAS
ncbi:hypothetical protein GUJ93_ZPchr0006g43387 [Zizania palustris]|uniref:FLZ-type domain-containing protein n=1 Tax=Zizania palustris TaxID=103762 RepID=A0A8J5T0D2_ZIZPA|nr:hypothetical protein GUJ93_ZPchr0006g43387 [Zizania palustris]